MSFVLNVLFLKIHCFISAQIHSIELGSWWQKRSAPRSVHSTCYDRRIFFYGSTALVGLCLLTSEVPPRSYKVRHTTIGRTPLDEWSARRRDLYLTTHNTHKRQTTMPAAGFETSIPPSERQQTHALDHAATRISDRENYQSQIRNLFPNWAVTTFFNQRV